MEEVPEGVVPRAGQPARHGVYDNSGEILPVYNRILIRMFVILLS